MTDDKKKSMRSTLTNEQIAKKLVVGGESVQAQLPFKSVELHNVITGAGDAMSAGAALLSGRSSTLQDSMQTGMLVLTDKRLLFVSNTAAKIESKPKDANEEETGYVPAFIAGLLAGRRVAEALLRFGGALRCAALRPALAARCLATLTPPPRSADLCRKHLKMHEGKDGVFLDDAGEFDCIKCMKLINCKCECCPPECVKCYQICCGCQCCTFCLPKCLPCQPWLCASRYVMSSKLSEKLDFFPLPLVKVRHVSASAYTSTMAETHIYSQAGLCAPVFPCLSKRTWEATPPGGFVDMNERSIELQVLLPPWNKRTRIAIQVDASVDIEALLTFINKLESSAPALLGGVPDASEGDGVSIL